MKKEIENFQYFSVTFIDMRTCFVQIHYTFSTLDKLTETLTVNINFHTKKKPINIVQFHMIVIMSLNCFVFLNLSETHFSKSFLMHIAFPPFSTNALS